MDRTVKYIGIDASQAGQKLLAFLGRNLRGRSGTALPAALLHRLVRSGQLRVNRRRAKPTDVLQAGDVLRLPPLERVNVVAPWAESYAMALAAVAPGGGVKPDGAGAAERLSAAAGADAGRAGNPECGNPDQRTLERGNPERGAGALVAGDAGASSDAGTGAGVVFPENTQDFCPLTTSDAVMSGTARPSVTRLSDVAEVGDAGAGALCPAEPRPSAPCPSVPLQPSEADLACAEPVCVEPSGAEPFTLFWQRRLAGKFPGLAVVAASPAYLVLNKPAGLPVHGGSGQSQSVISLVLEAFRAAGTSCAAGTSVQPAGTSRGAGDAEPGGGTNAACGGGNVSSCRGNSPAAGNFPGRGNVPGNGNSPGGAPAAALQSPAACPKSPTAAVASAHTAGAGLLPGAPGRFSPTLAHRLDRGASGVLVIAGTYAFLRLVQESLQSGWVRKTYLAWVQGRWTQAGAVELRDYLVRRAVARGGEKVVVQPEAAAGERPGASPAAASLCLSRAEPVAVRGNATLLRIELLTGRTHQLRVQLSSRGHPIIGDCRYGGPPLPYKSAGGPALLLHSCRFALPEQGLEFTAWPDWPAPFVVGPAPHSNFAGPI